MQHSEIERHGTVQDKSNLPQATSRNQADRMNRVFTLVGDAWPDGSIRVNKVARTTHWHKQKREGVVNAFESAWGLMFFLSMLEPMHNGDSPPPGWPQLTFNCKSDFFFMDIFTSSLA